jgi:hypothetical protein
MQAQTAGKGDNQILSGTDKSRISAIDHWRWVKPAAIARVQ